ncbi:hypothetical protein Tco_1059664, partial [Tanacetum coccineum]
ASKKLTGLSVTPVKVLSDSGLKKTPIATSVIVSSTLAMVPSEALLQAEAEELSLKVESLTSENLTLKSEINQLPDNSQILKFQNVKLKVVIDNGILQVTLSKPGGPVMGCDIVGI